MWSCPVYEPCGACPSHERRLDMDESKRWGLSRYGALLVVVVVHIAFIAALLSLSTPRTLPASAPNSVELLILPPTPLPKIRSENSRPQRLSGNTPLTIAPLVLDSPARSLSLPAAGSDGNGSGVDWAAEARRALQAYEIRGHQPPGNTSISGSPAEDNWWPRQQHHAGDQYKTAAGDWIVWISSSCYRVASAVHPTYAPSATQPQTVCPRDLGTPAGNPPDKLPPGNSPRPKD